jgi:glutamate-1-semialdehyde 2,1-aminomutase
MATKIRSYADAEHRYLEKTPTSKALFERAKAVMPAGVTRHALQTMLYPIVGERGEGAFMIDADENRYLDMISGSGATILGPRNDDVVAEVRDQVEKGLGFTVTNSIQIELAELIKQRVPSMELVRFTTSGTEATMFAIRLARAFSGKTLLARNEGSYHGLHDMMMTGHGGALGGTWLGYNDNPVGAGIVPELRESVVFMRFNDLEYSTRVVEAHKDEIGVMILEPFAGTAGGIDADPAYLKGMEALCRKYGIILIFDEMVTIAMDYGGAQGYYGIKPDMTATGKMIGGGMPIGVLGGRAEIMNQLAPAENGVPPVMHSGTWNGHPVCMQAGVSALKRMTPDKHAYLREIGDYMRNSVRAVVADCKVPFTVTGVAHMSGFHFNPGPVRTRADALRSDGARMARFGFSLLSQGFLTLGTRTNLNTEITKSHIDSFAEAVAIAFEESEIR